MATVEIDLDNNAISPVIRQDQWATKKNCYRCHISLIKEDDGGYSAIVLNLPGVGSCGDTEEEATGNVREAVSGAIESYLDAGEEIPWEDSIAADIPDDAKHKWILVNV